MSGGVFGSEAPLPFGGLARRLSSESRMTEAGRGELRLSADARVFRGGASPWDFSDRVSDASVRCRSVSLPAPEIQAEYRGIPPREMLPWKRVLKCARKEASLIRQLSILLLLGGSVGGNARKLGI